MRSLFVIVFMFFATQAYSGEVKVYKQYAVPAFEQDCQDPMNEDDPWCEFEDPSPYAITWVDMLIPKAKIKTNDCDVEMSKQKQLIQSETNPKLWGAKLKYRCDASKGKWVWRNPNFKWE